MIVGQSIVADTMFAGLIKDGVDGTSVEGAASIAYDIPNLSVELSTTKTGVPVLWWRVVGNSPYRVRGRGIHRRGRARRGRRRIRVPAQTARARTAHEGGLGTGRGEGRLERGAVAERQRPRHCGGRSIQDTGGPSCGGQRRRPAAGSPSIAWYAPSIAVHPSIPMSSPRKWRGASALGSGAVLHGAITLKDGRVEQNNFNDYRVLRYERDADSGSAYRALNRAAHGGRRTWGRAPGTGRRQRHFRRDGQAHPRTALPTSDA